jgi:cytochrome c biogenesis protein CcmG, thiol:disulfide interchange protein DsbE
VRRTAVVVACLALVAVACSKEPAVRPNATFDEAVRAMRGKPLVVNFWATWCDPCKSEMPRLVSAAKRYAGRVRFLGVDVQDNAEAAAAFAQKLGVPYSSIPDPQRRIVTSQNILGLPVTQFYDADGDLQETHRGEIDTDELRRALNEVLRASRSRD